jgi:hypothetical protein
LPGAKGCIKVARAARLQQVALRSVGWERLKPSASRPRVHCIRREKVAALQSLAISARSIITQADNLRVHALGVSRHASTSASLSRSTLRKTRKLVAFNYAAKLNALHYCARCTPLLFLRSNPVSAPRMAPPKRCRFCLRFLLMDSCPPLEVSMCVSLLRTTRDLIYSDR